MAKVTKAAVLGAIKDRKEIRFTYTDVKGATTTRVVAPEEVMTDKSGQDVIIGIDKDKGEYRRFKFVGVEDFEVA